MCRAIMYAVNYLGFFRITEMFLASENGKAYLVC